MLHQRLKPKGPVHAEMRRAGGSYRASVVGRFVVDAAKSCTPISPPGWLGTCSGAICTAGVPDVAWITLNGDSVSQPECIIACLYDPFIRTYR